MAFKLKFRTMFPASVTAASPLTLVKTGLAYAFGIDIDALREEIFPSLSGTNGGILFNNAGTLDTSSVALNATFSGYPFFLLGNQPTVLTDISFTGSRPPAVVVGQNLSHNNIVYNSFLDVTTITPTNAGALFCSYAAAVRTANTAFNIGHICWGEDFFIHNGSGTITDVWTLSSAPTINTGGFTTRKAFTVSDFAGAGAGGTQYGLYIAALTKATTNWGVYTVGATPSYFGGQVLLSGTQTTIPTGPQLIVHKGTTAANQSSLGGVTVASTAQFISADGDPNYLSLDVYGTTATNSIIARRARGTQAAPTAIQSGDGLFQFTTMGYAGSGAYAASKWSSFGAILLASATENWSPTNQGSAWDFYTTAVGGTSLAVRARISEGLSVGSIVPPGIGAISATAAIRSSGATQGVGYATGAGGTVPQATSRTTGVTLDKVCGAITLFAAAPAVGTWVSFTVTNSTVAATDVPHVAIKSGTNTYIAHVTAVAAGSFQISFTSIVGTASDSPVINFDIVKAVTA